MKQSRKKKIQQKTRSCRFQIQQHISQQENPDANNKEKLKKQFEAEKQKTVYTRKNTEKS